jgi:DNA-binding transcriptional LysR family regulator
VLEQLDALKALKETGTTARAAVRLRITQSAVSKRVAALEAQVGAALIEREGRGCRLTAAGERLLREALPLLASLRDVVDEAASHAGPSVVRVACSESLLASWLPGVLATVRDRAPGLRLELHAHRGPALVARVASGDADVAIAVDAAAEEGVVSRSLGAEPMVLAPRAGDALKPKAGDVVECWTIEERSLTWASIEPRLRSLKRRTGWEIRVTGRIESFTALARLAAAGFAHALVPRGIAIGGVVVPGLDRPLALLSRKTAMQREGIARFVAEIEKAWPKKKEPAP